MAINYFLKAKKMNPAPIYLRFSEGKRIDFAVDSGLKLDPDKWSVKKHNVKFYNEPDKEDEVVRTKLGELDLCIRKERQSLKVDPSPEWLNDIISKFHNPRGSKAKNLNQYIAAYIYEAEKGKRKNKSSMLLASGTINIYKGFQRIFNEFQGIYTPERLEELRIQKKKPRPIKKIDFDSINIDFYHAFVNFLTDEGYARNTMGRFIKTLKLFMRKAHEVDKLHNNLEFKYEAFRGISEETYSVYLTEDELTKIFTVDLKSFPNQRRYELVRAKFIVLAETGLRVSDYDKIDINIREIAERKFIDLIQTKTGTKVIIPLTIRLEAILKKHAYKLPKIPYQYVDKYIKDIAMLCKIDEICRWEDTKYGKTYPNTAKKYELISCHTARRSACTNMYKAGIPLSDIRAISGHSTDKQLMSYIKITKEETATRLAEHDYFTKLRAV